MSTSHTPPARDAMAIMALPLRSTVLGWWLTVALIFVAGAVIRSLFQDEVNSSTWQYLSTAPKVMHFVVGVMLPTALLPMFVRQGITRRAFTLAAAGWITVVALGGAVIMAVGYGIEVAIADAVGWGTTLDAPHLFEVTTQWWLVIPEYLLAFLIWTVGGWLTAVGYARGGWLVGTVVLPLTLLPVVLGELALTTVWAGDALVGWLEIDRPSVPVAVLMAVAALAAGAAAAWTVVRELPVRPMSGWTR